MGSPIQLASILHAWGPDYGGHRGLMSQGKCFFLDPLNGNDSHDGKSISGAVQTLPAAKALLTAGRNETVFYLAGTTGITLTKEFDWDLDYTHLIGIAAPVTVASRARVLQLSTATGVSPLIKVSATGCIFDNLYFFHGVADATSKICFSVTGQQNYFSRCHFAGIGDATMDVAGAASLNLTGSENVFDNCAIGLDTQGTRGANSTELLIPAASSASRNMFNECRIYAYISSASHALVTIGATGIDRYLHFRRCVFSTDSVNQGVAQTSVFNISAATQGKIILQDCMCITDGTPAWDSNSRGLIWNNSVAAAASAAGGKATKI